MPDFQSIQWFTGLVAGLCVLGLPVWMMGLPGVDGQYAKGWKIGLNVLFLYPVGWLINRVIYWRAVGSLSGAALTERQTVTGSIYLFLCVVAILGLIFSFMRMRKPD